jgi:hypothetical protein
MENDNIHIVGSDSTAESLPMLYTGVYQKNDGHEGSIDFDEPGWLNKIALREARIFTLQPKPETVLPTISVHLTPLPDGTPRTLVFFTRVFGCFGQAFVQRNLFRMYCIGWKATIADRELCSVSWIYPSGSVVVLAGEKAEDTKPPYVDELIEHYMSSGA